MHNSYHERTINVCDNRSTRIIGFKLDYKLDSLETGEDCQLSISADGASTWNRTKVGVGPHSGSIWYRDNYFDKNVYVPALTNPVIRVGAVANSGNDDACGYDNMTFYVICGND